MIWWPDWVWILPLKRFQRNLKLILMTANLFPELQHPPTASARRLESLWLISKGKAHWSILKPRRQANGHNQNEKRSQLNFKYISLHSLRNQIKCVGIVLSRFSRFHSTISSSWLSLYFMISTSGCVLSRVIFYYYLGLPRFMYSASETYSNAAWPLPHCDEARKHLAFCWPAQRGGRKPLRYSYSHAQWINKVLL